MKGSVATDPAERLSQLDSEVDRRAKELFNAERERDDFITKHCAANPLSDALVAEMADHVRSGGALCCKAGRAWLDEHVDAIWARVLNDWAYDVLSCSEDRPERIEEYARKVSERKFERRATA